MKIIGRTINNGFFGVDKVETYSNFVRFCFSPDLVSEALKNVASELMGSEPYEKGDEIYLSVIVPYKGILDFGDAILHISEISHALRPDYIEELTNAINNKELIAERFGNRIELETVELINLLSAA